VGPPIDAFEQYSVDLGQQRIDGVDDFDAHLADLLREAFDAIGTGWQVRTAAWIGRHDFDSRQVPCGRRIIHGLRERDHVRRIQPDHADANRRRRFFRNGELRRHQQHRHCQKTRR
jgi:hypothetical protein